MKEEQEVSFLPFCPAHVEKDNSWFAHLGTIITGLIVIGKERKWKSCVTFVIYVCT